MKIRISRLEISGTVTAPASKSVMQRACAAALIRGGEVAIHNYGKSNDDKAALEIIQQLGATVEIIDDSLLTISTEDFPDCIAAKAINCGESGLSARMFTSIAALSNHPVKITGEGSLLQRPFDFFDIVFPKLNVAVNSNNGKLPLEIKGALRPANITINGSLSSQYLTGLLFAFSACDQNANIYVDSLSSKPYVDLTLQVMKDFGLNVPENNNYKEFIFHKSQVSDLQSPIHYTIESDWSSASFLLVAGAVSGNVAVKGLDVFSQQADKKILEALQDCGCNLSVTEKDIAVSRNKLHLFQFDATDCPDLFPPLAALALFCNGTSIISGVHRLKHKESNRARSIIIMCEQFGGRAFIQNDEMVIEGNNPLKPAIINTFNDHRIAMAAAVIAMNTNGETIINDAECVNKSYPGFWKDIEKLGAAGSFH